MIPFYEINTKLDVIYTYKKDKTIKYTKKTFWIEVLKILSHKKITYLSC